MFFSRGARPRRRDRLLFLHIPRSGGTSFTRALAERYGPARIVATADAFPEALGTREAPARFVAGHFYAHQIPDWAWERFDIVTVMRDPLERLISSYRYCRRMVDLGRPVTAQMRYASLVSFRDYALSPRSIADRHMALFILGSGPDASARTAPLETLLERAKARLETVLCVLTRDLETEGTAHRLNMTDPAGFEAEALRDPEIAEVLAPDRALYDHAIALSACAGRLRLLDAVRS